MQTKDDIIAQFKWEFAEFMDSEETDLEYDCLSFGIVQKILKELGFIWTEDITTNGWEVDYWTEYKKDDVTLFISGSMYYGNLSITKGEK